MDNIAIWGKKLNFCKHVSEMQEISLPPKYVKQISSFLSLCSFALGNAGTEMLKRIELAFIFSVVVLI